MYNLIRITPQPEELIGKKVIIDDYSNRSAVVAKVSNLYFIVEYDDGSKQKVIWSRLKRVIDNE